MRYFAHIDLFDLLREQAAAAPQPEQAAGAEREAGVPAVLQVPLLPRGKFEHEVYGPLEWTDEKFLDMRRNFHDGVTGFVPMLNADHASQNPFASSAPAFGWFQDLPIVPSGLDLAVEFTDLGREAVANKRYRYISAEVADEYTTSEGKTFKNVILGAALTNLPFHDTMRALFSRDVQGTAGASATARCFSHAGPASFWAADPKSNQGGSMTLLEWARKFKKLPATATEADAVAALEAAAPPEPGPAATTTEPDAPAAAAAAALDLSKHPAVLALEKRLADQAAEITTLAKRAEDADAAASSANAALLEKDAREAVKAFIASGKIAPAQEETALKFALADPVLFRDHYEHAPPVIDLKSRGYGGSGEPAGGGSDFSSQVTALMQAEGLDYLSAANAVAEQNPDLYEKHRQNTLRGRAN